MGWDGMEKGFCLMMINAQFSWLARCRSVLYSPFSQRSAKGGAREGEQQQQQQKKKKK